MYGDQKSKTKNIMGLRNSYRHGHKKFAPYNEKSWLHCCMVRCRAGSQRVIDAMEKGLERLESFKLFREDTEFFVRSEGVDKSDVGHPAPYLPVVLPAYRLNGSPDIFGRDYHDSTFIGLRFLLHVVHLCVTYHPD